MNRENSKCCRCTDAAGGATHGDGARSLWIPHAAAGAAVPATSVNRCMTAGCFQRLVQDAFSSLAPSCCFQHLLQAAFSSLPSPW